MTAFAIFIKISQKEFFLLTQLISPQAFFVSKAAKPSGKKYIFPLNHYFFRKKLYICTQRANDMGVTFDDAEKKFVFDFEHDGAEDIVSLTGDGYQVEAFGKCFYYGYEFSDQVDGSVRSAFIKYVKFTEDLQENPDLTHFIKKAIDNLDKQINLYDYDLVVMPESSSKVNQYMLRYIYRFAQPTLRRRASSSNSWRIIGRN